MEKRSGSSIDFCGAPVILFFQENMASSSNTLDKKTLSTEEVLAGIFADNDSGYEVDSDSKYSALSSEVSSEEVIEEEEVIEVQSFHNIRTPIHCLELLYLGRLCHTTDSKQS